MSQAMSKFEQMKQEYMEAMKYWEPTKVENRWEYTETELWRQREGNTQAIHVFGLISVGQVVMAFTEAREGVGEDFGEPHSVWMRRSVDGGRTFEPNQVVIPSEGRRCLNDITPVYDEEIGRLFLFYSEGYCDEKGLRSYSDNFLIHSDDLGITWSEERLLGDFLKTPLKASTTTVASGRGIQLKKGEHAGRLIMPIYQSIASISEVAFDEKAWGYRINILYSDDHGETWCQGEAMGNDILANESGLGETKDGILRIVRPGTASKYSCYQTKSLDGGETWSELIPTDISYAHVCQMGLVCFQVDKPGYEDVAVLSRISNPRNDDGRRDNMELLISYNGGDTFTDRMNIAAADAIPGYSVLCLIEEPGQDPVVGLLHCSEYHILFSRISLEKLTGGKFDNPERHRLCGWY